MTADRFVVLLEDDDGLRSALSLVLRARGFQVAPAGSAREAIALLEERPPDAVVADLSLPDMSGTEVMAALRSAAPEARLVVLTGHGGDDLRRGCFEAGADEFVVKPVSGKDLASLLRS